MSIDQRMARLEGVNEQINLRLDSIERRLDSIEARLTSLEGRLTTMMVGLYGTMIAGFIALGVAIIMTR